MPHERQDLVPHGLLELHFWVLDVAKPLWRDVDEDVLAVEADLVQARARVPLQPPRRRWLPWQRERRHRREGLEFIQGLAHLLAQRGRHEHPLGGGSAHLLPDVVDCDLYLAILRQKLVGLVEHNRLDRTEVQEAFLLLVKKPSKPPRCENGHVDAVLHVPELSVAVVLVGDEAVHPKLPGAVDGDDAGDVADLLRQIAGGRNH
mmetsp:Transcript_49563/g.131641  ORF Transcript_49563/g.131641 Transcript_49563/m.131641 type:complete len:204 (-) Transcript_49563:803-1414(-)